MPSTGCNQVAVMALLVLGIFCYGITIGGDLITPAEMSKKFPATIYSIVNMVAQSAGMVAPLIIGVILNSADNGSQLKPKWDEAFYMTAALVFNLRHYIHAIRLIRNSKV